jgi:hypothetical protein
VSVGMGSLFGGVREGGIVLSLCDRTGNMVRPWQEAGYDCWIVDMQHEPGVHRGDDGITRVGEDMRWFLPPRADYSAVFAFPPCTDLAVSGARWYRTKGLRAIAGAAELVERCRSICEWSGAPWMLENPVGTLSTYWREPDYTFNPCDFGGYAGGEVDNYTKRTCLWTGGGFVMPEAKPIPATDGSRMWKLAPSAERANLRSETPAGFARAVFEANAPNGTEAAA